MAHAAGSKPFRERAPLPARLASSSDRLRRFGRSLVLAAVVVLGGLASHPVSADPERRAEAPTGWQALCARETALCEHHNRVLEPPALTLERRDQLERVNREVNHAIVYKTDLKHLGVEEFWSFPINGTGDCEDFVLEKRRRLMELGWPRAALLISVVVAYNGEWHAVLTAETDAGPLVLDNMTDLVLPPEKTGHRFHSAQSREHPNRWVMWSPRVFADRTPTTDRLPQDTGKR